MAILSKSKDAIKQQAQEQDYQAAVFENQAQRKLNALARTVANDYSVFYATTGQTIDTTQYLGEIETILKQTYRKVNADFSNTYFEDLETAASQAKTESKKNKYESLMLVRESVEGAILASLLLWSQATSPIQSRYIADTWAKIIKKRTDDTIANNIAEDKPIDNESIAFDTKKPLTDELVTHNELVATQEVQAASENAKFTEVDELNNGIEEAVIAGTIAKEVIEKVWQTIGDNKVRASHAAANGQRRGLKDPFFVQGEFLRYPKDTSLGASVSNVIHCRCKSVYL